MSIENTLAIVKPDAVAAGSTGKIIDMIGEWQSKTEHPFISFEYFPPKTPEGVTKLHKVIGTVLQMFANFPDFCTNFEWQFRQIHERRQILQI